MSLFEVQLADDFSKANMRAACRERHQSGPANGEHSTHGIHFGASGESFCISAEQRWAVDQRAKW
ncbi:hypothetical protein [Pseudomonas rustica]